MQTENTIIINAPPGRIYQLAACIERWPEILPHYRWVTILRDEGQQRLVEMAASRDGFPLKWVSIQQCDPARHSIRFRHVRGISRGMAVEWSMEPAPGEPAPGESSLDGPETGKQAPGGTLVRIVHDFDPPWPRPVGPLVARYIVGALFVHNVAGKTLRHIKMLAESTDSMPHTSTEGSR